MFLCCSCYKGRVFKSFSTQVVSLGILVDACVSLGYCYYKLTDLRQWKYIFSQICRLRVQNLVELHSLRELYWKTYPLPFLASGDHSVFPRLGATSLQFLSPSSLHFLCRVSVFYECISLH